jgi:hypothetical protein
MLGVQKARWQTTKHSSQIRKYTGRPRSSLTGQQEAGSLEITLKELQARWKTSK